MRFFPVYRIQTCSALLDGAHQGAVEGIGILLLDKRHLAARVDSDLIDNTVTVYLGVRQDEDSPSHQA